MWPQGSELRNKPIFRSAYLSSVPTTVLDALCVYVHAVHVCVCVCVCVHVDLIILVFVSGVEWISVCVQLDVHTYLLYLLDAVRVCACAHVRACDCVCVRMLI